MTKTFAFKPVLRTMFAAVALGLVTSGGALASGADTLKAMIEEAKKEPAVVQGRVTLALISLVPKANELFNKAFGLNKTIKLVEGSDNTFTTKMMASLDMGGTPELSFYSTNGGDIPAFVGGNYALKIKDWEAVLAEINPRVKSGAVTSARRAMPAMPSPIPTGSRGSATTRSSLPSRISPGPMPKWPTRNTRASTRSSRGPATGKRSARSTTPTT